MDFCNFQKDYVLKMKIAKQKIKVAKSKTQILQKPRLLSPSWKGTFLLHFKYAKGSDVKLVDHVEA
jgi:hypothetical protein